MSRTVIFFRENLDRVSPVSFSLIEPTNVPDGQYNGTLNCTLSSSPFQDLDQHLLRTHTNGLVQRVGQKLFNELIQHPGVNLALNNAIYHTQRQARPIYFGIFSSSVECLPWEALYCSHHNFFFALDARYPIARIPYNATGIDKKHPYSFEPPLRIAAVLGARDQDAQPEWMALSSAITEAGIENEIQVHVFVAQTSLYNHILEQSRRERWLSVDYVSPDSDELVNRLQEFSPHLLHFFCHGSVEYSGFLEIATRNTVELNDDPLFLGISELRNFCDSVWMVILNACESGAAVTDSHSLAYNLVDNGLPAAIGMRKPIDARDANKFCRAFYTEAFQALHQALQTGQRIFINWAELMTKPRKALCRKQQQSGPVQVNAAHYQEWTLPVLYQQLREFQILRLTSRKRSLSQLNTLLTVRERISPNTPEDITQRLDRMIAQLEEGLYGSEGNQGSNDDVDG